MRNLVTEDDIARARTDPEFRQQLMALSLERLLEALNKMRETEDSSTGAASQIREGVALAVKLADKLQQNAPNTGPKAA
jgi:hypothetical protein